MFILITKKQKYKFVNGVVGSVCFTLNASGKVLKTSQKFALEQNLAHLVGIKNNRRERKIIKHSLGR